MPEDRVPQLHVMTCCQIKADRRQIHIPLLPVLVVTFGAVVTQEWLDHFVECLLIGQFGLGGGITLVLSSTKARETCRRDEQYQKESKSRMPFLLSCHNYLHNRLMQCPSRRQIRAEREIPSIRLQ